MILNGRSDSPRASLHREWLAYLERFSESSNREVSACSTDAETGQGRGNPKPLTEEAFCSRLAELDELSLREVEGRLSRDMREQMHELEALLLSEWPTGEATGWSDGHESLGQEAAAEGVHESPSSLGDDPRTTPRGGAQLRRDRWRQHRRGSRPG